jgi:acyl-CoA reductase-like NAD-dependent aldehyde dehydrogenase
LIVCTRCGTENVGGKRYCSSCQASLPQIVSHVPREADKVLARYNQLKEASDKVKMRQWSLQEFAGYMENIAQVLAEKEEEIREIEIPEEGYEDFADELEVGFNGIALYNEGISHMMLYIEDQNPEHLDYGLELVLQGNDLLNEAMKINRETRRRLEEMYIDTSTMM